MPLIVVVVVVVRPSVVSPSSPRPLNMVAVVVVRPSVVSPGSPMPLIMVVAVVRPSVVVVSYMVFISLSYGVYELLHGLYKVFYCFGQFYLSFIMFYIVRYIVLCGFYKRLFIVRLSHKLTPCSLIMGVIFLCDEGPSFP